MRIDAKYGNCAPENMAVTLEAVRNSHIIFHAASCDYHLRRDTLRITYMEKKITRLFVCFVHKLTVIFYVSWETNIFLAVCNLPYYRHPSVCYGQQVLEKFPVNSALCHVYSRCFIVNIYCGYMWMEGSSGEQSTDSDIYVLFKEVEIWS